jgi:formiminotetrahydrofolate cyclodeaminase
MSEKLTAKPVKSFLDELASSAPAPGGGSVAALAGALGAALISMVNNLTLGKEKYAAVQDDIKALLGKSESLRQKLADLLEEDVVVYTRLNQTMKMPRDTEEQKAARARAMDRDLKAAAEVPLRVAEACVAVMDLCRPVAEKGNANAVSDVGVGILMAEAGLRSAALNVLINLGWIKDAAYVSRTRQKLDALLQGRPALRDEIYEFVASKL